MLVVDGVIDADTQPRRHHSVGGGDVHCGIACVGLGFQLVKQQGDVGLHTGVALNKRLRFHALHRHGVQRGQRMVFRQQNQQLILADGQPHRHGAAAADQTKIRAVIQQHFRQFTACAVDDFHRHTGVARAEGRRHTGDPLIIAVVRRANDNRAAVCAAHLGRGLLQPFLCKQQLPHSGQKLAALLGGLHAAFCTVQQRKAQFFFQRCHTAADAGNGDIHLIRRRTQTAAVDCLQ